MLPDFETRTGGYAFTDSGDSTEYAQPGMTLLDWFAGKALAGMIAIPNSEHSDKSIATAAYNVAEAMIAERNRREVV